MFDEDTVIDLIDEAVAEQTYLLELQIQELNEKLERIENLADDIASEAGDR